MSELGSLFLVVLLVYLLQCLHWVPPGSAVFVLRCRGLGKEKRHGFRWNALGTTGFLAGALPPLAPLAVAAWPGFELAAEGIWIEEADRSFIPLSWSNLTVISADSKVFCNERLVFQGSEVQALAYGRLLQRLQCCPDAARGPAILGWLRRAMAASRAARLALAFARGARWLRVLANLQLALLFLALPLSFVEFGPGVLWRVAVFMFAISAAITLEFWMLHKKLFREAGPARFKAALTMMLSPIAAIRACDTLARDLFARHHPLAVAAALLPEDEFRRFAGERLRFHRFGNHPSKWFQENSGRLMEQTIRQRGIKPAQLMRPAHRDSGSVVYCPRCLAQYVKERSTCSDCGFEQIVRFESKARSTTS
jgi:hypothetical protein